MPINLMVWPKGAPVVVLSDKQIELNSLNLDYDATAFLRKSKEKNWALILEITLKRKITRSVIETIAPSGLLVVVSWVSHSVLVKNWNIFILRNSHNCRQVSFCLWIQFQDEWGFC